MISVALLEDNRMVREGLATLLKTSKDIDLVTATPAHGQSLLTGAAPDVILLDAGRWDEASLRVVARLGWAGTPPKIIIMNLHPMHDDIVGFVHGGVSGFILQDATLKEFVATIRAVARGDRVLPAKVTSSFFSQIAKNAIVKK